MLISSREVEAFVGPVVAARLCEWIREYTPITCVEEYDGSGSVRFDIDEAMEFSKIRMHSDALKREFFPYFVKLKQHKVSAAA